MKHSGAHWVERWFNKSRIFWNSW